jgi:hypothetical protein
MPEEVGWCRNLLTILDASGIPAPDSDFQLAQFAISCEGDTAKASKLYMNYRKTVIEELGYDTETARAKEDTVNFMEARFPGINVSVGERPGCPSSMA